ncbi:MAG: hypothetical protein A3I66_10670 [Burkholderiales bacterium RIFCSPLOWO2_02_FULL_57_36]|nr:MAG: hypothetical protein A3I66_10670 [Burkholderiales bacterium RIFCSPLOWO2_02_FULL_57_36]
MSIRRHNIRDTVIGLVVMAIPLAALTYKLGVWISIFVFFGIVFSYLFARLALFMFAKRNPGAKGFAILICPELVFMFFLPRQLKLELAELKEKARSSSDMRSKNGDASAPPAKLDDRS